jgi:hypothetical protein
MMKRGKYLKILLTVVCTAILLKLVVICFAEPWVRKKIVTTINEKNGNYIVSIERVHLLLFSSGLKIENIIVHQGKDQAGIHSINCEISSAKFRGIRIAKALLKKNIDIREVIISGSNIIGKISFPDEVTPPLILLLNIRIGSILCDKTNISLENNSDSKSFSVKDGILNVYDLEIEKHDTLSVSIIRKFDFSAKELVSVSPDSMYLFKSREVNYSCSSNTLTADSFIVHPNHKDYDFTSRYKYQKVCIDASFSNISIYNFDAADFLRSENLVSSYIEIGQMNMKVFRDKRKEFLHEKKTVLQEMIYSYPGILRIDSLAVLKGIIVYTEHAGKANDSGSISFSDFHSGIYNITNDTIYKTKKAFFEIRADASLMGKSRINLFLQGKIFDSQNTFSLNGNLSALEASELNPILEKNAFIYATSGRIDGMSFSFSADNNRSTGKMTLLYHGLDLAAKNKETDDTTAIRERVISLFVNLKVLDSNPIPAEEVRGGIINFERDPERFIFHYCFRSILSGVRSTLVKNPEK